MRKEWRQLDEKFGEGPQGIRPFRFCIRGLLLDHPCACRSYHDFSDRQGRNGVKKRAVFKEGMEAKEKSSRRRQRQRNTVDVKLKFYIFHPAKGICLVKLKIESLKTNKGF